MNDDLPLETATSGAPQSPPRVEKGDTLANVLRRRIADDILSEKLRAGTRLDERSLARDFGVSRTPVREALQQLVAAGLATSRPHAGTVVRGVDPSRVASMCEASILLESICARLAAGRMTAVEVGRLCRIHEACQACHEAGDALGYAAENRKFHSAIIEGAKNPDLRDAVEFVRLRIAPFQRAPFASAERRDASQAEHAQIIAALSNQDAEAATEAMTGHLSAAAVAIDEHLQFDLQGSRASRTKSRSSS